MINLKEMFQLSDRGARDLKKGIAACTFTNLSLMLSVIVTIQVFIEVLKPLAGETISWNRMWLLFGAGIIAGLIHFFCCKNDYRQTYVSCYTAAEDSRIRIAESVRKFPMSVFNNKDLTELTTNMMGGLRQYRTLHEPYRAAADGKRHLLYFDLYLCHAF
ncbi:MAG: hypothetical protein ACRC3H_07565 [Lachnospiraceae bacterium]